MASVEKRVRDGRTTYLVRWRDDAGVQRKRSFTRKLDADRYRTEVEHRIHSGTYVDPAAGKQTFSDYAERWRSIQPHRTNTATRVASQLTRHAYPALGAKSLATIRTSDVQALAGKLSATMAPGSVRTIMATVRAVFAAALRDRAIGIDPAADVKVPPMPRKKVVPLTVEQVNAIADVIAERYRALVVVGAGTGLRQGELFGLELGDVDFLRRTLRVERQIQPVGAGTAIVEPKNRAAHRIIPIGKVVATELAAHIEKYPPGEHELIFTDESDKPLYRSAFNTRIWRPAVAAANVPGTGCHDLRHFYASVLIASGQSVKVVSERLGHTNAAMTLNVYSHLFPADEDRSRQAVDDAFGIPAKPPAKPRVPRARPKRSTTPKIAQLDAVRRSS